MRAAIKRFPMPATTRPAHLAERAVNGNQAGILEGRAADHDSQADDSAATLNRPSRRLSISIGAPPRTVQQLPPPNPAGLTVEILGDREAFDRLAPEWNKLHTANDAQRIGFQSHGWLTAWLDAFAPTASDWQNVKFVTARQAGELRVVCPLILVRKGGMRRLCWLGEPASQYGDVVCDGTRSNAPAIRAAMDHAVRELKPDVVWLRKVRCDAAITDWLETSDAVRLCSDEAPFLDFRNASRPEDYCQRYSAKSRKNRRRLRRRLEELGPVEMTVLPPGLKAQNALTTAIHFKRRWLEQRGELSSALRDRRMDDFLTRITAKADYVANPYVSIMTCAGRPVSIQFGLLSRNRLALHLIAYDPTMEKTGAGILHIEETVAHAINSGWRELDFLAPGAAYKSAWADTSVNVANYALPCTHKGRAYMTIYSGRAQHLAKRAANLLPLSIRRRVAALLNHL